MKWLAAILLAVLALPVAAANASQWFYERQPVAQGQAVEVASSGTLKLKVKAPGHRLGANCGVSGVEVVTNSPEGGLDETRAISFFCTGEVVVTPTLPWRSMLSPIRTDVWLDEWTGVHLDVSRSGVDYGVFTGTLSPTIGDGDAQGPGQHDDLDNTLSFHSTGSRLAGPGGATLSFVGFYKLGTRGHGASAGAT